MASHMYRSVISLTNTARVRGAASLGLFSKRSLLTEAHSCQDVWNQRLESDIFKKIDVGQLAINIQEKLDQRLKISALDIDILANKLEEINPRQVEFVTNIIKRFRHSVETVNTFESTSPAVFKALIALGQTDTLIEVLNNKVDYGMFLDSHTASHLLDQFIENKNYEAAAQIAIDLMLQEELVHPISKYLAWYACHLRWMEMSASEPLDGSTEEAEEAGNEEEEYHFVRYIRNPWYDDHWDIPQEKMKIGKTLFLITHDQDDLLGRSFQVLGLGLYEKFEKGLNLLKDGLDKELSISKVAFDGFKQSVESVVTKEPTSEKEVGTLTLEDIMPCVTENQKSVYLQQVMEIEEAYQSKGLFANEDLTESLEKVVRQIIIMCEETDIKNQKEAIQRWNKERQEALDKQLEELKIKNKKLEIAKNLVDLQSKEEKLRFFEEEARIRLGVKEAPKIRPIKEVKEEEQFVHAPGERGKSY